MVPEFSKLASSDMELPRLDEMTSGKDCTEKDTKTSYDNIRDSQEIILSADDGAGR
jgi:hypothetical protein